MHFYSKVENFTMAFYAYIFGLGQTNRYLREAIKYDGKNRPTAEDFALRQLRYRAFREYAAVHDTPLVTPSNFTRIVYHLLFDNNFQQISNEFESHLLSKNLSNVYEYLYSIARIGCSVDHEKRNRFLGHLIRYGRICQVWLVSFFICAASAHSNKGCFPNLQHSG